MGWGGYDSASWQRRDRRAGRTSLEALKSSDIVDHDYRRSHVHEQLHHVYPCYADHFPPLALAHIIQYRQPTMGYKQVSNHTPSCSVHRASVSLECRIRRTCEGNRSRDLERDRRVSLACATAIGKLPITLARVGCWVALITAEALAAERYSLSARRF